MLFRVFDTHLGEQVMEGIGEIHGILGPSLSTMWSISCTGPHGFQQGNTDPLPHPQKIPSGLIPIYSRLLYGIFLPVSFPPMFDMGEIFKECEGDLFPIIKIMNREITF
jgi:hypothetical protein